MRFTLLLSCLLLLRLPTWAQPGSPPNVVQLFRVYTPEGQRVTPDLAGWRVSYSEGRRHLLALTARAPAGSTYRDWLRQRQTDGPLSKQGLPVGLRGFFDDATGQYVLLQSKYRPPATDPHLVIVHGPDTMRVHAEAGLRRAYGGRGFNLDSIGFRPGTFRIPAYLVQAEELRERASRYGHPVPTGRLSPGLDTDWEALREGHPLPVVYAEPITLIDERGSDIHFPSPSRYGLEQVPSATTAPADSFYFGQDGVYWPRDRAEPLLLLLRQAGSRLLLYPIRDLRPPAVAEQAPRPLRAGPRDTLARWRFMGLLIEKIQVDSAGRLLATGWRQYPATATCRGECVAGYSGSAPEHVWPLSRVQFGTFRLYLPGELSPAEIQAKQARYWLDFYQALHGRPAEQALVRPYLPVGPPPQR